MIEVIEHLGWPHCVCMTNGVVDLIATTDVGPRIIHYGFAGGPNLFKVFDEQAGLVGNDEWRIYGGHRLWHAPERKPWTYAPDNEPIEWRADGDLRLILHQPAHPLTSISKTLDISLAASRPEVSITHRLRNEAAASVELAPWALTALAPGGTAVLPLPAYAPHDDEHLLPVGSISLWSYADLRDPRLAIDSKAMRVRQDGTTPDPFKIGLTTHGRWCAYENNGIAFVKHFRPVDGARYPDRGAQVEVFTNDQMLELETLGPLASLAPGESAEHEEQWTIRGVTSNEWLDDVVGTGD
jgi:hypothetical protein